MPEISRDEFQKLQAAAERLPRCWYLFRHSNSPGKVNFQYSFFIREFIKTNPVRAFKALDSAPEEPVIQLSAKDYLYFKQCLDVTHYLEYLIEQGRDFSR
ncbi:hypothetical protein [Vagococcus salmoninarum]|uniref:hypothetical protein n=1 Tax=Vagococcus salmoninarum TaxID=2739 RepID=UPI003F9549A7